MPHVRAPVIFSAMQDATDLLTGNANGYISGQIFYDVFQARYGSGQGGVVAMGIPLIGALGCGALSVASNSRCPGSLDVLRSLHVFSRLPLNLTPILSLQALFPLVDHAMSTAKEFSMAPLGCTLSVCFPLASTCRHQHMCVCMLAECCGPSAGMAVSPSTGSGPLSTPSLGRPSIQCGP